MNFTEARREAERWRNSVRAFEKIDEVLRLAGEAETAQAKAEKTRQKIEGEVARLVRECDRLSVKLADEERVARERREALNAQHQAAVAAHREAIEEIEREHAAAEEAFSEQRNAHQAAIDEMKHARRRAERDLERARGEFEAFKRKVAGD